MRLRNSAIGMRIRGAADDNAMATARRHEKDKKKKRGGGALGAVGGVAWGGSWKDVLEN